MKSLPQRDADQGQSASNLIGFRNLFRRTSKMVFVFSSPADDLDLDRFQAAGLHSQGELFVNFYNAVLLEAVAHA